MNEFKQLKEKELKKEIEISIRKVLLDTFNEFGLYYNKQAELKGFQEGKHQAEIIHEKWKEEFVKRLKEQLPDELYKKIKIQGLDRNWKQPDGEETYWELINKIIDKILKELE